LTIFIDCLIDKDYTKLIIEGNATNEELEECFSSLYMQYVEAAGGREAIKKLESTQTVALMQMRVKMFEYLIGIIKVKATKELFDYLYTFHTYYPIVLEFSEENTAKVVNSMIPYWKSETIDLMNELERYKVQNGDAPEVQYTYDYFNSMIVEMESSINMKSDDNMTVGKFCSWLNKYKAYVKSMESQQLKMKR
jgi:hypothetical protein